MSDIEQSAVDELLVENPQFQRLYERHKSLKETVTEVEAGVSPVGHDDLRVLKKEKLLAKDQMSAIVKEYQRSH